MTYYVVYLKKLGNMRINTGDYSSLLNAEEQSKILTEDLEECARLVSEDELHSLLKEYPDALYRSHKTYLDASRAYYRYFEGVALKGEQ